MALNLPRLVLRVPTRRIVAQRNSSGGFYGSNNFDDFKNGLVHGVKSSESTTNTWKKIFYIASIPCILMTFYAAYREHEHHQHQPRKDHIEYPYLNVRNKPFPWGDGNHSLFHNPSEQYVPGVGFEKDKGHH